MLQRQMPVRQDVFGRVLEDGRRLGEARPEAIGDLPQLRHRRRVVRLREDRADNGRDRLARALGHRGEQIAHEMHAAPLPAAAREDGADRLLQPFVRVGDHQADTLQPPLDQAAKKRRPERAIFRRADVDAEDLAIPLGGDAHGHDGGLADDVTVDPHLVIGRIDPEIAVLTRQRPCAKGRHDRVEFGADARDLGLRDPVDAERLDQIIDLPGRDPMHVRLLHHGEQRMLRPPTRLQQRREVRPRPNLGNGQLDRAHPRVPRPRPGPIAIRRALPGPLVSLGANQASHLRFHQRLGEHPDTLPEDIAVLLFEKLANERRQIHSGLRHRVNTSVSSFSGQRELTERCAMAAPAVYAAAVIEFPPRPGTLTLGDRPVEFPGFSGDPVAAACEPRSQARRAPPCTPVPVQPNLDQ